jgi:hypothetical protein
MIFEVLENNIKSSIKIFINRFLPVYELHLKRLEIPFMLTNVIVYSDRHILRWKIEIGKQITIYKKDKILSFTEIVNCEKIDLVVKESKLIICDMNYLDNLCFAINKLLLTHKYKKISINTIFIEKQSSQNSLKNLFYVKKQTLKIKSNTDFHMVYSNLDLITKYGKKSIQNKLRSILGINKIPSARHNMDLPNIVDCYLLIRGNTHQESENNLRCYNKVKKSEDLTVTKFHDSKTIPMEFIIVCNNFTNRYLYKHNSDISNDLFFNTVTDYIFRLLNISYKTSNVYENISCIEMKNARSLSTFGTSYSFKKFLTENDSHQSKLEQFLKTFSVSLLINYLFEIGDRTLDNMILDKKGNFYNIDFEYILGDDPKYFINLVVPTIISDFLRSDALIYEKFKMYFIKYYMELRENSYKILIFSRILYKKNTFNFKYSKLEDVLIKNLNLYTPNIERIMTKELDMSMTNYRTKMVHLLNKLGKIKLSTLFFNHSK